MRKENHFDNFKKIFGRSSWEFGIEFEHCMRRCFGNSAYGIAASSVTPEAREKWKRKLIKKLLQELPNIDTSDKHRKHIEFHLNHIAKTNFKSEEPSYKTIFNLLDLIISLFGYDGIKGKRMYKPVYWKDINDHVDDCNERGKGEEYYSEYLASGERRTNLVKQMKEEGLTDFQISLVLQTSEYEVKKLKKAI